MTDQPNTPAPADDWAPVRKMMAEAHQNELINRFTYHAPKGDQVERYAKLRNAGLGLATLVDSFCPLGDERDIAIRKIEEAIFWANAAIARNE